MRSSRDVEDLLGGGDTCSAMGTSFGVVLERPKKGRSSMAGPFAAVSLGSDETGGPGRSSVPEYEALGLSMNGGGPLDIRCARERELEGALDGKSAATAAAGVGWADVMLVWGACAMGCIDGVDPGAGPVETGRGGGATVVSFKGAACCAARLDDATGATGIGSIFGCRIGASDFG